MSRQMRLAKRTALVTGGAGGIGRAIALSLAQRGCHLALADIDDAGMAETAALAAPHGVQISCHTLDVADAAAVCALPAAVQSAHGRVDLLVNNAGVALNGTFAQICEEDFAWLFAINFHGLVRMTRAFLPLLKASDDARLVNLSSVFGLIAPPGQTAYAASKFAVRGFSEALRQELHGSSVGVTVVHPGGIATNIAKHARQSHAVSAEERAQALARLDNVLKLPPAVAGETIVKGVERRRDRVLVGTDAKLIALLVQLAPVAHGAIIRWLLWLDARQK